MSEGMSEVVRDVASIVLLFVVSLQVTIDEFIDGTMKLKGSAKSTLAKFWIEGSNSILKRVLLQPKLGIMGYKLPEMQQNCEFC